jgi:hypothetical protein
VNKKIGRNDPCPCGSGKKYKKCCGMNASQGGFVQTPESFFPQTERTGTLWDDYMELIPMVALYGRKIQDFDKDGREFNKATTDFEKRFRPGERGGITDSIFLSWMYFDLRFGKSLQTVAERLLSDPMIRGLNEPGPTYIRELSESYLTFFEIVATTARPDAVTIEELGTGERWTVLHVRKLFEIEPVSGEIWFARRVGSPERSIFYTTPYIFEPDSHADFKKVVKALEMDFKKSPRASSVPAERHFAESQKESTVFWTDYMLQSGAPDLLDIAGGSIDLDFDNGFFPELVTTEGEELVFVEIHFRIKDEAAVRKRLSTLRSFQYDERDDSWTWLKARSSKYPDAPRSILGDFRIEGDRLVAETNSGERATKLRGKLTKHLQDLIAYEKTLYQDPFDFPERSPEEIEAREKSSQELNALPEIQEALKKHLEHHYFNEWPKTKIPALGGLSPRQAARSKKGREKLEALIDDIERNQNSPKTDMPKIDIDKLRQLCGLLPDEDEHGG